MPDPGMDNSRISALIAELDGLVPREGATVKLVQYGGGPDESQFVANRLGYLRFGIEFLRSGLAAPAASAGETPAAAVDLEYLIHPDSDISFDWFERLEDLSKSQVVPGWTGWVPGVLLPLGCVAVAALAVLGAVTLVRLMVQG